MPNQEKEMLEKQAERNSDGAANSLHEEALAEMQKKAAGKNAQENAFKCGKPEMSGEANALKCGPGDHGFLRKLEPDAEEIKKAQDKFADNLSKLISESDRQTLRTMADAIMSGSTEAFQKSIMSFKGDRERLAKFVAELDDNFRELNADIRLTMAKDGSVLLYKESGQTCVSIAPGDGSITLRPIRTRFDGTAVLEPGEVVGANADKVMKDIGNEAVMSILNPFDFHKLRPVTPYQIRPGKIDPDFGINPAPHYFPGVIHPQGRVFGPNGDDLVKKPERLHSYPGPGSNKTGANSQAYQNAKRAAGY